MTRVEMFDERGTNWHVRLPPLLLSVPRCCFVQHCRHHTLYVLTAVSRRMRYEAELEAVVAIAAASSQHNIA